VTAARGPARDTTCPGGGEDGDDPLLADRLLAKLDREHNTNCDVQIGDGMDIRIIGENGNNGYSVN
jgi:hypothetical protein